MNKKAQFWIGGLIDASTLPKWILYPLLIAVMLILFVTTIFMGAMAYSFIIGKTNFIPFGFFGYGFGFPVMFASYHSAYSSQDCSVNGVKINCSDVGRMR